MIWLLLACVSPKTPVLGYVERSNTSSAVVLDEARERVWVADPEAGRVVALSTRDGQPELEIPLDRPVQLVLDQRGETLLVSDWDAGTVVRLDAATGARRGETRVGRQPWGLAVGAEADAEAYVAVYGEDIVQALRLADGSVRRTWRIGVGEDLAPNEDNARSRGWDPRALQWVGSSRTLVVGHFMNQRVSTLDPRSGLVTGSLFLERTDDEEELRSQGFPYLVQSFALSLDEKTLYLPHVLWNEDVVLEPEDSLWPALSSVVLADPGRGSSLEEGPRLELGAGLDVATAAGEPAGLADPIGAVISADSETLFLLTQGESQLASVDLVTQSVSHLLELPGEGASGLARSADGDTLYVYAAMSHELLVVGLSGDTPTLRSRWPTLSDPPVHPGQTLWRSARESVGGRLSCYSCHPDGIAKTNRWFLDDYSLSGAVDARMGHRSTRWGFASADRATTIADLVLAFQDDLGAFSGEDPDAPSAEVLPALEELEAWLHGPENLPFGGTWLWSSTGDLLDVAEVPTVAECARCHPDAADQLSASLHGNSGLNDPFYLSVEDELLAEGDHGQGRLCVGCHSPEAILTGSTSIRNGPLPEAQRGGMSCVSCHASPLPRAGEGNNPVIHDIPGVTAVPYPEEGEDPAAHIAVMKLPTDSSFCAGCHQSFLPGTGALEFFTYQEHLEAPVPTRDIHCVECHMPEVDGHRDHRFVGPSRWAALAFGGDEAAAVTLLQSSASLVLEGPTSPGGGQVLAVKVTNIGAGHKLPTGVSNLRDLWLEVRAWADGVLVFSAGGLDEAGVLWPDTPRFGKTILDPSGALVDRHQVWRAAVIEDTSILPGATRVSSYSFESPVATRSLRIEARLRYRSLSTAFVTSTPDAWPGADTVTDLVTEVFELGE